MDHPQTVMVPSKDDMWVVGKSIRTDNLDILIRLDSGEETKVPMKDLVIVHEKTLCSADDMTQLDQLHESIILHNIRQRYFDGIIYTYIGPMIICVNPYRVIPELGSHLIPEYQKNSETLKPHLFAIAQRAYKNLLDFGNSQSIVISGESGAGKTESTKIVLKYLTVAAEPAFDKSFDIAAMIIATNPILEAFGNAKTTRNDNSSRFGKFIKICFDGTHIVGSMIDNYLLEKTRIVKQAPKERNYHIFYQLLNGMTSEEKSSYGILESEKEYFYLTNGFVEMPHIDYKKDWAETLNAFHILGFTQQEINDVITLLSAILYLGNIQFDMTLEQAQMKDITLLNTFCKMLGLGDHVAIAKKSLTCRKVRAGNRGSFSSIPLTPLAAEANRDALAKRLYYELFNWLVDKLNKQLRGTATELSKFIGVLDIYGFEIFDHNSLEQLCINYANERLHLQFNQNMFISEQKDYMDEGVPWTNITWMDNSYCVDLIEKGIIGGLQEQAKMQGNAIASDENFISQMKTKIKNPFFDKGPVNAPKYQFGIKHFAGNVIYSAEGFLEKDKDTLNVDIEDLMKLSSSKLVSGFFTECISEEATNKIIEEQRRKSRVSKVNPAERDKKTVTVRFKEDLAKLVSTLQESDRHYVRCIKPNDIRSPSAFNSLKVRDQLARNGVFETVSLRKAGYAMRIPFDRFIDKYWPLLEERNSLGITGTLEINVPQLHWAMGRTKVFLRDPAVDSLNTKLVTIRLGKVLKLQSFIRSYNAIKLFIRVKSAITLQSSIRTFNAIRQYIRLKNIVALQSYIRSYNAMRLLFRIKTTIAAQSKIRSYNAQKKLQHLQLLQKSSITLQRHIRKYEANNLFAHLLKLHLIFISALVIIQKYIRTFSSDLYLNNLRIEVENRKKYEADRKRQEEERRKQEEERRKLEDERRKQEEERRKQEDERRKQEEEERKKQDEERRRQEDERRKQDEERRRQEEDRIRQDEERRRQEEDRIRQDEELRKQESVKIKREQEERFKQQETPKRRETDLEYIKREEKNQPMSPKTLDQSDSDKKPDRRRPAPRISHDLNNKSEPPKIPTLSMEHPPPPISEIQSENERFFKSDRIRRIPEEEEENVKYLRADAEKDKKHERNNSNISISKNRIPNRRTYGERSLSRLRKKDSMSGVKRNASRVASPLNKTDRRGSENRPITLLASMGPRVMRKSSALLRNTLNENYNYIPDNSSSPQKIILDLPQTDRIEIENFCNDIGLPIADIFIKEALDLKTILSWKDPETEIKSLGITQRGAIQRIIQGIEFRSKSNHNGRSNMRSPSRTPLFGQVPNSNENIPDGNRIQFNIAILRARIIPHPDSLTSLSIARGLDLFARLEVRSGDRIICKFRNNTKRKTLNPVWLLPDGNPPPSSQCIVPEHWKLYLEIWDYSPVGDSKIASATWSWEYIQTLINGKFWIPMKYNGEFVGELELLISDYPEDKIQKTWKPDTLGDEYQYHTILLQPDYNGTPTATLIRLFTNEFLTCGVLYIHDFSDYFWQDGIAEEFSEEGFQFYALDLRRFGRNIANLPYNEKGPNMMKNIKEYYEEIHCALKFLKEIEKLDKIMLCGTGFGGLLSLLYTADHPELINGLCLLNPLFSLNSCWEDFITSSKNWYGSMDLEHKDTQFSYLYHQSLHQSAKGEYQWDLSYKPMNGFPVSIPWVLSLKEAQKSLQTPLKIEIPILVLCSQSGYPIKQWTEDIYKMDIFCKIDGIVGLASNLGTNVKTQLIKDATHDILLSKSVRAREDAYDLIFEEFSSWMPTEEDPNLNLDEDRGRQLKPEVFNSSDETELTEESED